MKYTNIPLAHTVVALCKAHGVKQIVISPGSRNAPLILGFTSDPFFECFSVVDERSAGFFALGLSQQSRIPTALVCSSGSAMLNYYPAVSEAFYSRIPLLILSADRPPYMVDIGDGQTIRQAGVFGKHVGFEANLEQDLTHATEKIAPFTTPVYPDVTAYPKIQKSVQERNENHIDQAIRTAIKEQLPVHLNVPLEEPLYGTLSTPPVLELKQADIPENKVPVELSFPSEIWHTAARKLILIGSMAPGELPESILACLAEDPSVIVLTETTSNVHHSRFFPSIDSLIAPIERSTDPNARFLRLQPDILLTLGGMVVSKKIKQFLRKYPPKHHWHADPHIAYDTYFCLEKHYVCAPREFLHGIYQGGDLTKSSEYQSYWAAIRSRLETLREKYVAEIPFSDFKSFHHIFRSIPEGTQVQLSNSSTVRYAQLFPMSPLSPVYCNRGTSGIDGSTSTAVGAAWNYSGPTLLISGDLSFLYDANGLWNRALRTDFRIIVMHNGGGGIFRILPGFSANSTFETYFETTHSQDLEPLCKHHGLTYYAAHDEADLERQLDVFFNADSGPALLEVRTPRELNDKILLGYFDYLTW